jgi:hypothetical protein
MLYQEKSGNPALRGIYLFVDSRRFRCQNVEQLNFDDFFSTAPPPTISAIITVIFFFRAVFY